jgi:hypothetical protein
VKNSDMSVLNWLTEPGKAFRSIGLLCLLIIPFVASLLILPSALAQNSSSSRDCDSNAVINCGAMTVNELQNRVSSNANARAVYSSFGISSADISNMDSTSVNGTVTRGGRVMLNGDTVATNAMTAGMQNMGGSTQTTHGGITFFMRPPSVSFASSSLPAFVVMKNGHFDFAIIKSCGNPVKATPVVKKVARPKTKVVQPVTPAPTPPPTVIQSQQQSQQQTQTVNVSPPTTVVTAAPTPAPAPAPAPTVIPNTGAGDVVGFGSLVTLLSGSAHYLYRRSKFGLR